MSKITKDDALRYLRHPCDHKRQSCEDVGCEAPTQRKIADLIESLPPELNDGPYTAQYDHLHKGWTVRRDRVFVCSCRTEAGIGGDHHIGKEDAQWIASTLNKAVAKSLRTTDENKKLRELTRLLGNLSCDESKNLTFQDRNLLLDARAIIKKFRDVQEVLSMIADDLENQHFNRQTLINLARQTLPSTHPLWTGT